MTPRGILTSAVTILAAGLWTVGERVPAADEWPEPTKWHPPCVSPSYDLERVELGAYEWQTFELFGKHVTRAALWDEVQPHRCVAFRYDPNVLDDPPHALVISVADRKITGKWLVQGSGWPAECLGLPQEAHEVRGAGCRPFYGCALGAPKAAVEQ